MGLTFNSSDKVFGLEVRHARNLMRKLQDLAWKVVGGSPYISELNISHAIGFVLCSRTPNGKPTYNWARLNPEAVAMTPSLIALMTSEGYLMPTEKWS